MNKQNLKNCDNLNAIIKSYYNYTEEELKLHLSKWKEVELFQQNEMITHDDINEVLTGYYHISKSKLTFEQHVEQINIMNVEIETLVEENISNDIQKSQIYLTDLNNRVGKTIKNKRI